MDKKMIRTVLIAVAVMLILALGAIAFACPYNVKCQMHPNSFTVPTGQTKLTIEGKTWHEVKCNGQGDGEHTFWVLCD